MIWLFFVLELMLLCAELYLIFKERWVTGFILPSIAIFILFTPFLRDIYAPIILPFFSFLAYLMAIYRMDQKDKKKMEK